MFELLAVQARTTKSKIMADIEIDLAQLAVSAETRDKLAELELELSEGRCNASFFHYYSLKIAEA